MMYRDYRTMKVSGPKHAMNINFTKINTKVTQTLYILYLKKWSITLSIG